MGHTAISRLSIAEVVKLSLHSSCTLMTIIQRTDFDSLIGALHHRGYTTVGPTLRDGAIVYDEIHSTSEFPIGWEDEREKGSYRLKRRTDEALFGYSVGPQSWKRFLFPPREKMLAVVKKGKSLDFLPDPEIEHPRRYAFIGVRPCDISAIGIQDKVFMNEQFSDPLYSSRRRSSFIVAVNCTMSSGTCFCTSMRTGPRAEGMYDIALTEMVGSNLHYFIADTRTEAGASVIEEIPHVEAGSREVELAEELVRGARNNMGRSVDTEGIKEALLSNLDAPRWEEVARRCLMCANCTMVCPTCFCSNVDDVTDLSGDHAERWRHWDSCFTMDFAKVTGGNFRMSPKARYRQWLTHKFASWIDQFGTSGCVGCGRCITWCPVGIDVTEEVRAIRNNSVRIEAQQTIGA